ncbi:unnamed protein product [Darwinula stevensoni]|uniref:Uncharacterized protein n=1 Tax=Darwinula stevensoni TaxID=69355 RepID=A0A7R9AE20_9CRUS|nr:unnamed protein product [Darwinula stevensoni]CAG0901883.1 unnamed protein product [Darwinula stevensoni]
MTHRVAELVEELNSVRDRNPSSWIGEDCWSLLHPSSSSSSDPPIPIYDIGKLSVAVPSRTGPPDQVKEQHPDHGTEQLWEDEPVEDSARPLAPILRKPEMPTPRDSKAHTLHATEAFLHRRQPPRSSYLSPPGQRKWGPVV